VAVEPAAVHALENVGPAPSKLFDSSGLIVPALAELVADGTRILVGHDGRLYRYDGGVYRADGDRFARVRSREVLGERWRRRHVDEVVSWLHSEHPAIGEHPAAGLLNVRNGLVNLRTLELRPHSPEVTSTIQLPVEWDPEARCPAVERFLGEVLPEDALDLVLEIFGYATYPGNPLRVAVLLLGPGRNGKSVFLNLLTALLGAGACSVMSLQSLAENKFAVAELFGKLANICGDLDARAVHRSDAFKQIVGGDPMSAERKYGQPFSFRPYALPVFSANEAPISADQSEAWFDRWVIVPMTRRFSESEVDPFLTAKLTTPAELSGLLALAVKALQRLLVRGSFDRPESVRKAGEQYRDKLDSVRGFVGEACIIEPNYWTPRPAVYAAYRGWCKTSGRLPVSVDRFNDHLRGSYPMRVSESTRRGVRGWQGVALVTGREES
jgi:putative DNA primase/helicase